MGGSLYSWDIKGLQAFILCHIPGLKYFLFSYQEQFAWAPLHPHSGLAIETLSQLYNENAIVKGSPWENITNPFSGHTLRARSLIQPTLCSQTFQGVCSCDNGDLLYCTVGSNQQPPLVSLLYLRQFVYL